MVFQRAVGELGHIVLHVFHVSVLAASVEHDVEMLLIDLGDDAVVPVVGAVALVSDAVISGGAVVANSYSYRRSRSIRLRPSCDVRRRRM